jgi:hypothetical protein
MSQPWVNESVSVPEVFEAIVIGDAEPGRVSLRRPDDPRACEARNAVIGYTPTAGDRVVCVAGGRGVYVTGVLVAAPQKPPELRVGDARALVEEGRIVVRDESGALIVSYDPTLGVARVAGATVLALEAADRLELKSKEITVDAERLTQRVGDLVTEADRVATSADRWDLRVNKLTERAKNAFRDVEALFQTRAGTLRSIAREGMSLFADRTSIRSKKDTALDGERVLLG